MFINKTEHQAVFINRENIKAMNQSISKIDPLAEYMEGQKSAYIFLQDHCCALEKLIKEQSETQQYRAEETSVQVNEIKVQNSQYEKFEGKTIEQLKSLNGKIDVINKTNKVIINQFGKFEVLNEEIASTLYEQLQSQESLSEQLTVQKNVQDVTTTRLNNQEALMELVVRQLDTLRSTIYERTHLLARKIERSYEFTFSYIYELITNSNKPISLIIENQQQKEHQKNTIKKNRN